MRHYIILTALTLILSLPCVASASGGETVYLDSNNHCEYIVTTSTGQKHTGKLNGTATEEEMATTTLKLPDSKAILIQLQCGNLLLSHERKDDEGPNPRYEMSFIKGGFLPRLFIEYIGPGE